MTKYNALGYSSAPELDKKMLSMLKESAFSFPTVHLWVSEFKRSHKSVKYEPRSGRSETSTTLEIIETFEMTKKQFFSTEIWTNINVLKYILH